MLLDFLIQKAKLYEPRHTIIDERLVFQCSSLFMEEKGEYDDKV